MNRTRALILTLCTLVLAACGPRVIVVTPTPSPDPLIPTTTPIPPSPVPPTQPPTSTPTAGSLVVLETPAPPTASATPPPTVTPAPSDTPIPTPTLETIPVWIDPVLPDQMANAAAHLLAAGGYSVAPDRASAAVYVELSPASGPVKLQRVYVPVVPFATLADGIAFADIQRFWAGNPAALAYLDPNGQPPALMLTPDVLEELTILLGEPQGTGIEVVAAGELFNTVWERRKSGGVWSILPFERLDPTWKVLRLDGISALDPNQSLENNYPLSLPGALLGDDIDLLEQVAAEWLALPGWERTNRRTEHMTILAMTGVTALVRGTAFKMETQGITYPARDILPTLQGAHILHISNEIAFAEDCPYPNAMSTSLLFCSRDSYFDLLTHIGVDVVELTGNHVNDWGADNFARTLDMYDAANMATFGGGREIEAARKPAILQHNGNSLAFTGCNQFGPPGSYATASRAGSTPCDYALMEAQIAELKAAGHVVIATFQYAESYQYAPTAAQKADFERMSRAGADIVSGSQAHQPQGFGFVDKRLIHFGVGNLFFDQMWSLGTRQMFVDFHVIYEGRHISTALWTGLIEDYARPREMTDAERAGLLDTVFRASGW